MFELISLQEHWLILVTNWFSAGNLVPSFQNAMVHTCADDLRNCYLTLFRSNRCALVILV